MTGHEVPGDGAVGALTAPEGCADRIRRMRSLASRENLSASRGRLHASPVGATGTFCAGRFFSSLAVFSVGGVLDVAWATPAGPPPCGLARNENSSAF